MLLLVLAMSLQVPVEQPPVPLAASGAFFALSVADLEASTRWYRETFDMRVVMQRPAQDGPAVTVLEGQGLMVELLHFADAAPLSRVAPGVRGDFSVHGVFKAGILVTNFAEVVAALREARVEVAFGPFPATAEQRANVIIRDNGGNLIQIIGR